MDLRTSLSLTSAATPVPSHADAPPTAQELRQAGEGFEALFLTMLLLWILLLLRLQIRCPFLLSALSCIP